MGTNSYNNHRYLSTEEINMILTEKNSLKNLFGQLKNADGVFSVDELKAMTFGLVEEYILKRIINIFGTREIGMTCNDFLYFYSLLNTTSTQAKLEFLLDFIFYDKKKLEKNEYIYNIKKYLFNSGILLKIFLNEEIIKNDNSTDKIKREDVFNYIMKNHSEELNNYKLFINRSINTITENDIVTVSDNQIMISSETPQHIAQNKTSKLLDESDMDSENQIMENNEFDNQFINNNKNETLVINTEMSKNINGNNNNNNSFISNAVAEHKTNNKDKQTTMNRQKKTIGQNSILIPRIKLEKNIRNEKIKNAFQKIVKEENGVFPIALFEKMLKEINVIQSLIDVIGNFLRQKSQKTFINLQVLKEILNLIIIPDTNLNLIEEEKNFENKENNNASIREKSKEEIIDGLFTLFAYPNDFIHKKNFFLFAKSTKPELSSNTIKDWFNQYKITKFINKEKFKEIIEFIFDELYESFEHIKYLPYIFFRFDIKDKKIEKKCIDVLLKNRSLDEYLQERLQYDDEFYIIDKEFWDKWNLSMNKISNMNIYITPNNLSINIVNELNNTNNSANNLINCNNQIITNDLSQNLKLNSSGKVPNLNPHNLIKEINNNNNNNQEKIGFNTSKIADKNGKLKEGLVYMKDFVVLSKRMYQLFYRWYGTKKDIEIKRNKIYLEDENDFFDFEKEKIIEKDKIQEENMNSNIFPNINNNGSSNKISISKIHLNKLEKISLNSIRNNLSSQGKGLSKNYSFLKGISKKTHQKFEIELYPIFLSFFNFIDIQKKDYSSLNHIMDSIKENISKGDVRYYPFSRKSKYTEILQTLQQSLKIILNKNNSRLWLYYKNSMDICDFNDTLEKNGVVNNAVIILEINENNFWPSDLLKKEALNKKNNTNLNLVGLANIGNTCYMNSILQLFLNNVEIKKIFLDKIEAEEKFFNFCINKPMSINNIKNNCELILEFISLLREKFLKGKKTITPKKFKEICGNYNATFKDYEQQDAHDFYTFLVDNLHEETNIKSLNKKKYDMKEESDTIDTTEMDLSNESWANSIRLNASYFFDLFFGQMKSTLTCKECNKIKIKYENFSAVELPIFEGKKIILEIILFRLPFTLSPFYKTENLINNEINPNFKFNKNYNISTKKTTDATVTNNNPNMSNNKQTTKNHYMISANEENNELLNNNNYYINLQETKGTKSIRKKLKKLKIINIGKYADNICSSLNLDPEILNIISNEESRYKKIKGGNSNENLNKNGSQSNDESNLNTVFYEKYNKNDDDSKIYELVNKNKPDKMKQKNEIISNPLNLNIPLKLRIEIERNKKASEIIEILKKMDELKLEKNQQYTEFIILGNNKYVKMDSLIDETFLNMETIYIYELLNYEGIKKIFGYDDLKIRANPLNKQDIQSMLQIIEEDYDLKNNTSKTNLNKNDNTNEIEQIIEMIDGNFSNEKEKIKTDPPVNNNNLNNNNEISEILVAIFHEFRSNSSLEKEDDHFKLFNFTQNVLINNNLDFIILTNKNAIKPVDLYEIIWEKYMYYLNSPTKYESTLWWKPYSFSRTSSRNINLIEDNNLDPDQKQTESINIDPRDYKRYTPFSIKIVKKATRACVFCPWFRLCQGCVLNPKYKNYLTISSDFLIIVEWRRDVIRKDMKEENINYLLNHSSARKIFETSQDEEEQKNIYDCLDLFTREEIIKNIFCEKCNKKTNFKKRLEIDKFPKYLTLILKRFKYTKMFTSKIDNLIQFPLENLDMTNYITPKEGKIKYDLFGVVNHVGTLSGGHYHCDIKQNNIWIKYDDSYTCEYDKKIMTENAYLLMYKLAETKSIYNEVIKHEFKINLLGLIDTAYKIYLKQQHFEHFFNYVYENNKSDLEGIIEEVMTDCKYYYGEPITVNGKMGFLVNIWKNDENDKVYIKIKVKKGYYETNVSEKKIIKETVKISEENIDNVNEEIIKVPSNEEQNKVFCGSCIII